MKKLLVFAGSFDPFHNGHYSMLKFATTVCNYDKIILSISCQNPLKNHSPVNYKHRLQMVKIGLYDLVDKVEFDDFEQKNEQPSYTINLVRYLQKKYPDYEINFLIGSDSYVGIKLWKDIDLFENEINWIIALRNNDFKLTNNKPNVILLNNPIYNISSTKIKEYVSLIDMAPNALEYLNDYGLYGQERVKSFTTEKRYEHTLRVAKMTKEIMERFEPEHAHWGWTAGLYHDIAKTWSFHFQDLIGKETLHLSFDTPKVLHGHIGAYLMKTQFLFNNNTILNAIERHTKPFDYCSIGDITNLDMALYCADKLEPSRDESDCRNIDYFRQLLKKDLKQCFLKLYQTIQEQFHAK